MAKKVWFFEEWPADHYESIRFASEHGVFETEDDARVYRDSLVQASVERQRKEHAENEVTRAENYRLKCEGILRRQKEYDALVEAGLEPSFVRPDPPHKHHGKKFSEKDARKAAIRSLNRLALDSCVFHEAKEID